MHLREFARPPGSLWHGVLDQRGNLYVADCFGGRLQKFAPQLGADPARLVGAILRYPVAR